MNEIIASLNEKQTTEFFTTGVRMAASPELTQNLEDLKAFHLIVLAATISAEKDIFNAIEEEAKKRGFNEYVDHYNIETNEFILRPGVFFPEDEIKSKPKEGEK